MEWEQQKKNLLDALRELNVKYFYYFDTAENNKIVKYIRDLETIKVDEDLSEIKTFQEDLSQKLNRLKNIYQHPYYLIKPSTVAKLGEAFRKVLNLDNTPKSFEYLTESFANSGGHYKNLYENYINGSLAGMVHVEGSKIKAYAFYDFPEITGISAPKAESTGKEAFVGCTKLETFYAPKASSYDKGFGSDPLTSMKYFTAGFDLYSVSKSTITYKAWGSSTSTTINPVFTKNGTIKMISLPGVYQIGKEAFSGCTSLASVYLMRSQWSHSASTEPPKENANGEKEEPKMTTVEGVIGEKAFADCTSLETIEAPGFKKIHAEAFKGCGSLKTLSLPGIYSISDKAFLNCTELAYVSLPAWSAMNNTAFNGCNKLISINLGVSSTTSIFNTKATLETIIMSKATTINANAFKGLTSLKSISFPSAQKIEKQAFDGCTNITLLESPLVTVVSTNAFSGCTSLSFVNIANCKEIQANAFSSCIALTDIIAPSLISIDKAAFTGCTSLTNIYAPLCKSLENVPFNTGQLIDLTLGEDKTTVAVFEEVKHVQRLVLPECTEIGKDTFKGFQVSYVSLPKCTKIGEAAFQNCQNLKYIVLSKVTNIGKNAFNNCENLKEVILLNPTKVTLGENAFPPGATIYVRDDNLEQADQFNTIPVLTTTDSEGKETIALLEIFDVKNNLGTPVECYQTFAHRDDRSLNAAHIGTIDEAFEVGNSNRTMESYIRGFYLDVPFYKELPDINKKLKSKYDWEISNNKYEIKYNEENTCYIYDKIPVEPLTLYQVPKCFSLLQLDSDSRIVGDELVFNPNTTQYKFKTGSTCKYITLKFNTETISSSDVKIYEIKSYNHKYYYEIQDNEFIVGPKFIYDNEINNYKKVNMVKYLYVLPDRYRDNFWSREVTPERITFAKMFAEDLLHYTFFIDNTMPYLDTDPDLYENRIPLPPPEEEQEEQEV